MPISDAKEFFRKKCTKKSRANCFSGAFFEKQFLEIQYCTFFFDVSTSGSFQNHCTLLEKPTKDERGGNTGMVPVAPYVGPIRRGHRSLGNRREEGNVGVSQFRHSGSYEGCQNTATCTWIHCQVYIDTQVRA